MRIKKLLLLFIVIISLVFLFDKVIMPAYVRVDEIKVPNVVGMTYEQGVEVLKNAGLEPVKGGERFDERFPKGTIILQRPVANKIVKEGRRIYVIVSGGNIQIDVPDLRYKTVEEASIILQKLGLLLGNVFEDTLSNVPKGLITSQSYEPNSKVDKGSPIDVYVSNYTSSGRIEVPNLIGLSLSEAESIIKSKNLVVGKIVYQTSLYYLPNTIVFQYPDAGSYVDENTPIDLIVVTEKLKEKEIIE